MRLYITGITITLLFSMIAFVLSFQACDTVTRSIDTGIYDTIDTNDCGSDVIDDTGTANRYKKIEWIVFDVDGEVVDRKITDSI